MDFSESKDGIRSSNSTLESTYKALLAAAGENPNEAPAHFFDLTSAQGIHKRVMTRLREAEFLVDSIRMFGEINKINSTLLSKASKEHTYLTDYLKEHYFDLDIINENNGEMAKAYGTLVGVRLHLTELSEKTQRLVDLAKNANVDLRKVYIEDVVKKGKQMTDDLLDVFTRDGMSQLMEDYPTLKEVRESLALLNDFDTITTENVSAIFGAITRARRKVTERLISFTTSTATCSPEL